MNKKPPTRSKPTSGIVPPTTDEGAVNLGRLKGQQRAAYDALLQKDLALKAKNSKMAQMYIGSILVLQQVGNPDRFALAAHGIRELMEKMSRYLDVPVPQGAGEAVRKEIMRAMEIRGEAKSGSCQFRKKTRGILYRFW
jgi:hypothetical protein